MRMSRLSPRLPTRLTAAALLAGTFIGGGFIGGVALAAPSAESLQAQLREWMTGFTGPAAPGADQIEVEQDGDRYTVTMPIAGMKADDKDQENGVTAHIHPLAGGAWSIDDVSLPTASTYQLTPPAGTMHIKIGDQTTHGTYDPSYATKSAISTVMSNLDITVEGGVKQTQHYDSYGINGTLTPRADGRLDLTETGDLKGMKVNGGKPGEPPTAFSADTLHLAATVNALNKDRIEPVMRATAQFTSAMMSAAAQSGGAAAGLPGINKDALRALLGAMNDIAASAKVEESLDGLKVVTGTKDTLGIDHFALAFGGDAPGGILQIYLDIGMDGLVVASQPADQQAFIPRHLRIRPTLGGVGAADALKILTMALDDDGSGSTLGPAMLALFAHGGVKLGVETLSVDIGPAKITGTGLVTAPAPVPDAIVGDAHLEATGLDELIAELQKNPDAAQVAGGLSMAKALGKPSGGKLVWDISYKGGNLLVNGQNMMGK
jgi:hypothetical protein